MTRNNIWLDHLLLAVIGALFFALAAIRLRKSIVAMGS
jgi:hypothetical protein